MTQKQTVTIVVPSCRPESLSQFLASWSDLFSAHSCSVVVVRDDTPNCDVYLYEQDWSVASGRLVGTASSVLRENEALIPRRSPACRCIGFVWAASRLKSSVIVTLDDDLSPDGDTIADHIKALNMRVPTSWLSSTMDGTPFMRGFPYGVRNESPVWVSHGVWKNVPDLDAPSQLVLGDTPSVSFYRGPVPKGVYFPVCGMNLAFRREALPFMYWCPAKRLRGAERFDDIWMGIHLTEALKERNAALVSGYASCVHTRASNKFANLEQEAVGIRLNESYWQGDTSDAGQFFSEYNVSRQRWKEFVEGECE